MSVLNPYTVLQVAQTASIKEIKAAYKKLAFAHHPDRNKSSAYHTERFKEIVEAYALLSDPDKRARFDRHHAQDTYHRANQPQRAHNYQGPSPYGSYTGFDPLRDVGKNQPNSKTYTGRGGKRYTQVSPHQIFIGFFIVACTTMGFIWLDNLMSRKMAETSLQNGDCVTALEYDSSYADAWFALAKRQLRNGDGNSSQASMAKAFALTEDIAPDWYWHKGQIERVQGHDNLAKTAYYTCIQTAKTKNWVDDKLITDSCKYRLGEYYIASNQPDSAYMILKQAGEVAAKQPSFTYAFGISALNAGHFSESLQALQSAANSNYRYADSYYYLGQAYLVLADTSQACIAWDISLTGGHPKVDSLIQKWCTFGAHTTVKHP